ncbi:MAG: hypothetical protein ACE5GR_01725 [Nitrosopumilus sp.]
MKNSSIFISRRGVSSIVGALLFTVLMIGGFSVLGLALDAQSDIVNTQRIISENEREKQQENFAISPSLDQNNILQIDALNLGQNTLDISSVWIVNKTHTDKPANRYELDYRDTSIPKGYDGNILENTPLYLQPDVYDIKVVSDLGTIKEIEFDTNDGSNFLRAELVAIPPDVRTGENATIAVYVTNTGDAPIQQVQPVLPLLVDPVSSVFSFSEISTSPITLNPSESTLFTWEYQFNGTAGTVVNFSNIVNGTIAGTVIQSNNATDSVTLQFDKFSGTGTVIVNEELFSKPGIFMTIPNPFGTSTDKGLWGVNIANPTDRAMNVSKVVAGVLPSTGDDGDNLFNPGCALTSIPPTVNFWACRTDNQLSWVPTFSNEETIPARSVKSFLVQAQPGSLHDDVSPTLDFVLTHGSVFSSLGHFGKTNYGTSMQEVVVSGDFPIANVYLTDNPTDPQNINGIRSVRTGILSGTGTPETFNVVFTDFDTNGANWISKNSKLIINVPPGWQFVDFTPNPDFNITVTPPAPDGSVQIIGDLQVDLDGDLDDGDGKKQSSVLTFRATPPNVFSNTMYVMYILADGFTDNNFSVGPLSEVVLQVCPNTGCT